MPRDCRTYTKINPALEWGWTETLANKTNYLLEMIIWQNATPDSKGKRAAHQRQKPNLWLPDFLKPAKQPSKINKDANTMTVDDVKSWLSAPRGV